MVSSPSIRIHNTQPCDWLMVVLVYDVMNHINTPSSSAHVTPIHMDRSTNLTYSIYRRVICNISYHSVSQYCQTPCFIYIFMLHTDAPIASAAPCTMHYARAPQHTTVSLHHSILHHDDHITSELHGPASHFTIYHLLTITLKHSHHESLKSITIMISHITNHASSSFSSFIIITIISYHFICMHSLHGSFSILSHRMIISYHIISTKQHQHEHEHTKVTMILP